jgi:hypothetical protein
VYARLTIDPVRTSVDAATAAILAAADSKAKPNQPQKTATKTGKQNRRSKTK